MSLKYIVKQISSEGRVVDYVDEWDTHEFKWDEFATPEEAAAAIEARVVAEYRRGSLVILGVVR